MNKIKNFAKKNFFVLAFISILFIIKLIIILNFDNKDWEPDSYMHFIQLKSVYENFPHNLDIGISVWAKPLYTYLLAIPILIFNTDKLLVLQITNLIIFSLISFIFYKTVQIIYGNKVIGFIAMILLSLGFLSFKSSISALTEPIFTLTLVLGFYFALKQKYIFASTFFGLAVLGRIEGLFFVGIYNLWLIYKLDVFKTKKFKSLIINWCITIVPVFVWNLIGFLETDKLLYIFDKGYPTGGGQYGYGSILDFPKRLIMQEPLVFLLFILSACILVVTYKKVVNNKELLLSTLFFSLFTFSQMFFWVKGMFGSAGLMRYLIAVMPFAIITGMLIISNLFNRYRLKDLRTLIVLFVLSIQIFVIYAQAKGIGSISQKWLSLDKDVYNAGIYLKENYKDKSLKLHSVRPEVIYYAEFEDDWDKASRAYNEALDKNEKGIYVWAKDWEDAFHISFEQISSKAEIIKSYSDNLYIFEID